MTSLALTAPRSDTWFIQKRRAEMLDRLRMELQREPGKAERKRKASEQFLAVGE